MVIKSLKGILNLFWSYLFKVYLDEINTASCLGLFKEIIVDRTIDGDVSYLMKLMTFYLFTSLYSFICSLYRRMYFS